MLPDVHHVLTFITGTRKTFQSPDQHTQNYQTLRILDYAEIQILNSVYCATPISKMAGKASEIFSFTFSERKSISKTHQGMVKIVNIRGIRGGTLGTVEGFWNLFFVRPCWKSHCVPNVKQNQLWQMDGQCRGYCKVPSRSPGRTASGGVHLCILPSLSLAGGHRAARVEQLGMEGGSKSGHCHFGPPNRKALSQAKPHLCPPGPPSPRVVDPCPTCQRSIGQRWP